MRKEYMMKKILVLLMILTSVAVFGQEVEDEEDKPTYIGSGFYDILGKATRINDLMLEFDYKIKKADDTDNVYFSKINENHIIYFATDEDGYIFEVLEEKHFNNTIDVVDDLASYIDAEEIILTFSCSGSITLNNAVKQFLKEGSLDMEYFNGNTSISYTLLLNNDVYIVRKGYFIKKIVHE